MRDGNVPRFFVRRSAEGRTQLVGQLVGQFADPANPANPSFSGKEGREEEEERRGDERGELERGELERGGGVICLTNKSK